jgi:hypothetical protein
MAPPGRIQADEEILMSIVRGASPKHLHAIGSAKRFEGEVRQLLLRTVLAVLVTLKLLTCQPGVANAQYQPLNCDPQGRIFVALGHTVLGIPDGAITTGGITPWGNGPGPLVPPDATQKAGCYANPIQTLGLDSMAQTYAFHEARWWSTKNYPLTDVRLRELSLSKPGGMEDAQQELNREVCGHAARIINSNGIEICQRTDTSPDQSEISFKVSQSRFPTHTKKDFSFTCPGGANAAGLGWCDTSLVISQDIQINLEFYPPAQGYGTDFPEKL